MKWRWWRTRAEKVEAVLDYLREHGESPGRAIRDGCKLGRGTVYVLLAEMEDDGLISSRYDPYEAVRPEIDIRRRLYRLGGTGRRRRRRDEGDVCGWDFAIT